MAEADPVYDDEVEEDFEDAEETISKSPSMDLVTATCEARVALNLFLNNRFSEALERIRPWSEASMYHSLAHSTILYMQAILTFEKSSIDEAIASIKKSIDLAQSRRHRVGFVKQVVQLSQKTDYSKYTHEEVHAELIYAETLLLRALLTFIQDENLMSFIKGALKIRTCYHSYKECKKINESRNANNLQDYEHFTSGINMGFGAFNLMISHLPTKVLKLLEFAGFSGNKEVGLRELNEGSRKIHSLRGPLCSLILLAFHTLVTYILGTGETDMDMCDEILRPCLREYPNSALFLFFGGRIEEIRGNIDLAITKLTESMKSQTEWKQFHHICYWELMWCYSFNSDWLMAMKFAEKLANENRWSKATYIYLKASFLSLCENSEGKDQLVSQLYGQVASLCQRIAGKSLPIEKFAKNKAQLYRAQGGSLHLAALEMMYVWNGFSILARNLPLLERMLSLIEGTLNQLEEAAPYYRDNYSLAMLLKGVCLAHKGLHLQADTCFAEVTNNEKRLKHDTYLAPWAVVERALLNIKLEDYKTALVLLEAANKEYKGYALESRLHFKIHSAQSKVKTIMRSNAK